MCFTDLLRIGDGGGISDLVIVNDALEAARGASALVLVLVTE